MKPRLITTYLLSLIDLCCTLYLVSQYGIGIEANPIGVTMLQNPIIAVLYKVLAVALCLYAIYRFRAYKVAKIGSYAVFAVYAGLTVYHTVIIVSIGFLV